MTIIIIITELVCARTSTTDTKTFKHSITIDNTAQVQYVYVPTKSWYVTNPTSLARSVDRNSSPLTDTSVPVNGLLLMESVIYNKREIG